MSADATRVIAALTIRALIDDPVYLSEPYVRSRVWQLDSKWREVVGSGRPRRRGRVARRVRVRRGRHPGRARGVHFADEGPWYRLSATSP